MVELISQERVIKAALIEVARIPNIEESDGLLTYTDLGERLIARGANWSYPGLQPPFRGLGAALGNISRYEWALGRPLLSAIVVKSANRLPGSGFVDQLARSLGIHVGPTEEAWVQAEQQRVFDFWRDEDPLRANDAAFGRLSMMIDKLRRELR